MADRSLATITTAERDAWSRSFLALPEQLGQELLSDVGKRLQSGEVRNAAAYLIGTLEAGEAGQFNRLLKGNEVRWPLSPLEPSQLHPSPLSEPEGLSPDAVAGVMAKLREMYTQ